MAKVSIAYEGRTISLRSTSTGRTLTLDSPPHWRSPEDREWLERLAIDHATGSEFWMSADDMRKFLALWEAQEQRRTREAAQQTAQPAVERMQHVASIPLAPTTVTTTTDEDRIMRRVNRHKDKEALIRRKGTLWRIGYDIPSLRTQPGTPKEDRIGSPCGFLYSIRAVPSTLSSWIAWDDSVALPSFRAWVQEMERTHNECLCPAHVQDGQPPCSVYKRKGGCKVKIELTRVHPEEITGMIDKAREALRQEIADMHTSLLETLSGIQEKLERDLAEAETERARAKIQCTSDGALRNALRLKQTRLNAIVAAAAEFEETESVEDLASALAQAIKLHAEAFNKDASKRGVKLVAV